MKPGLASSIAFGAFLSLTPFSLLAQASATPNPNDWNARPGGHHEAMRMVAARAVLLTTLDSKKLQPGETFKAKLAQTIHLDNGPELPSGTLLIGSVEKDDMQEPGMSRLALRLTTAQLKTGNSIPIKATIVGVVTPGSINRVQNYLNSPGDQLPNSWTDGTLAVDQINVVPDTDLHSRIASRNSGVFVSTKKDDITLDSDSELQLAIAARHGHNGEGGSGSTNGTGSGNQ